MGEIVSFFIAGKEKTFNLEVLSRTEMTPAGQKCIELKYHSIFSNKAFHNNQNIIISFQKLKFPFTVNIEFGINITFVTFSLSDMCLPVQHKLLYGKHTLDGSYSCLSSEGTKYVMIDRLYFCYKRPQWSVYTKHETEIMFYKCQHCLHEESKVTFNFQVIDKDSFLTSADEYNSVLFFSPFVRSMGFFGLFSKQTTGSF